MNYCLKGGASTGNALASVAVIYSLSNWLLTKTGNFLSLCYLKAADFFTRFSLALAGFDIFSLQQEPYLMLK